MLNRHGDFPFTPTAYMNLVAFLQPHYYASMDYPCEPGISRKLGLTSNAERIRATVLNTAAIVEWESHVPGQLVPVIQGYTLDEYRHCIDLYHQTGLVRPYMAVGSMCRRISSADLHALIPGIAEHAQQAGARRLHFFGLKLDPSLNDLSELIYSRDSATVLDDYSATLRAQRDNRRWPVGQAEKEAAFATFLDKLETLGLQYCSSDN